MKIVKTIIILLSTSLIINSCKYFSNNAQEINETLNECKPYFAFDRIEYYRINVSIETLSKTADKKNRTPIDSLFENIMSYGRFNSLKDTIVVKDLEKIGYKKRTMPPKTYLEMNQIFCERQHENWEAFSCMPMYRDIFVFKQNERITGMAKICFTCRQSSITGTNCNTDYFGQSGDFEKLESILKPLLNQ